MRPKPRQKLTRPAQKTAAEGEAKGINLGLSGLLDDSSESLKVENGAEHVSRPSVPTQGPSEVNVDWRAELSRTERISDSEMSVGDRLRWVRANLELDQMPATMLVAPLERVHHDVSTGAELSESDRALYAQTQELLQARTQRTVSSDQDSVEILFGARPPRPRPAAAESVPEFPAHSGIAGARQPRRWIRAALLLLLLAFAGGSAYALRAFAPGTTLPVSEFQFASSTLVGSLSAIDSIADLKLQRPALHEISGINELSMLAYHLDSTDKPVQSAQSVPVRAERKPDGKRQRLQIGPANEPQELRALERQPEVVTEPDPIDFPPFRNSIRGNQQAPQNPPGPPDVRQAPRSARSYAAATPYMIIAPTRVMERPSYWSNSLGAFDAGDEVSVDAQVGVWLRVRLSSGRTAYILAQDAEAQ